MEGKKEEISFEIQSFKVTNAHHGVSQGCPLTPMALLMAAHYCQSCLQRGLHGLLLAQSRFLIDFDVWGQFAYNIVHIYREKKNKISKENVLHKCKESHVRPKQYKSKKTTTTVHFYCFL